jgi:hypothetical protein
MGVRAHRWSPEPWATMLGISDSSLPMSARKGLWATVNASARLALPRDHRHAQDQYELDCHRLNDEHLHPHPGVLWNGRGDQQQSEPRHTTPERSQRFFL